MNWQGWRRPPPARKADDDLANEPPTKALDLRFNQDCPTSQADIPAETVLDVVDELQFACAIEAADLAITPAIRNAFSDAVIRALEEKHPKALALRTRNDR